MDQYTKWHNNLQVQRTIGNLQKNNMAGYFVENEEELHKLVKELITEDSVVTVGGSQTLFQTNLISLIRNGNYNFLNRYQENLTSEDIENIYFQTFNADTYLTSSNAITEEGELYNIDGTGNRVAAMIYGPKQVIVVVGINKVVKDLKIAEERVTEYAAVTNAKRLNRNTPCTTTGKCMDCNSKERICCSYVVLKQQRIQNRIKVIIVNDNLGY